VAANANIMGRRHDHGRMALDTILIQREFSTEDDERAGRSPEIIRMACRKMRSGCRRSHPAAVAPQGIRCAPVIVDNHVERFTVIEINDWLLYNLCRALFHLSLNIARPHHHFWRKSH
jgi:hypothetical protein